MQAWTMRRARCSGFNLMEVLVAMGLFAFGFVAVAAIIPAGALLQKNTATDVQGRHVKRNASAIVQGTVFDQDDLYEVYYGSTTAPSPPARIDLVSFDEVSTLKVSTLKVSDFWSLDARSYPAYITDPTKRSFYWVPLLRNNSDTPGSSTSEWQVVIFVLQRQDGATYSRRQYPAIDADEPNSLPGLKKEAASVSDIDTFSTQAADYLHVNDWIVDNLGVTYRVKSVDKSADEVVVDGVIQQVGSFPDAIWYAPPADDENRSPVVAVSTVSIQNKNVKVIP